MATISRKTQSLFNHGHGPAGLLGCSAEARSASPGQESGHVRGLDRKPAHHPPFLQALVWTGEAPTWFILAIALWLWFTVLFANFAEAMAEGRGKPGRSLRQARRDLTAKKLGDAAAGQRTSAAWSRQVDRLRCLHASRPVS